MDELKRFWINLQPRERIIVLCGTAIVILVLFYKFIWAPWHKAIFEMQGRLERQRSDLVWIRQQAEVFGEQGGQSPNKPLKGAGESLMSVIDESAKLAGVRGAIKQLNPRQNNSQVAVALESVSFNKWIRWADLLQSEYGVAIVELEAERETEKPDIAEIRVAFERK